MTIKRWNTDKAVCIMLEDAHKSKGGLVLTKKHNSSVFKIIEPNAVPLLEGDLIMVADHEPVEYEGIQYFLVAEEDILCTIEE